MKFNMDFNRSPFFYVGDKYKLMPQLSVLFPQRINRLIEPFCGGGSVFLNTKASEYLENDKNEWVIKLHELLTSYKGRREAFFDSFNKQITKRGFSSSFLGINVPLELKKKYIKTYYAVYNKNQYNELKKDFNVDKNNMLLLYVLLIYGFNHMIRFNKNEEFNLPVGNVDYNKNVKKALDSYFDFVDHKEITFFNLDFKIFLEKIDFKKDDFVYLDPPYLLSSCEYNKGWTDAQETDLLSALDVLDKKSVKFALSNILKNKGNSNQLLIEWSKRYNVKRIKSNYINYHDNSFKSIEEVLITNY